MAAKQSSREGWSLIVVRHPSLENGWDIPHSQILGWHLGTACNEVWWGGCPDGEMTWGGTRQTDRWMERKTEEIARIYKGHGFSNLFHSTKMYSDTHHIAQISAGTPFDETEVKKGVCSLWVEEDELTIWLVEAPTTMTTSGLHYSLY